MSSLDYLDLCRLCLVKDRVSVPIFEGEGDVRQIFLKIAACLPVKLTREDKLPKKICDDCVYKVELFYQFWNTTANAEKQLLQWLGEVSLEDKQGYVTNVLNPSVMKQEQSTENRLDGNVMQQVEEHQNNMGMGMMDNMGLGIPMIISSANQQQITSVPMDTSSNSVQTIQAVPGPSSQTTHNQIPQNQTSSTQQEDEEESSEDEENSDEECDGDEGLPVKEESEEDPSNRTIEPTTFVNVSLACDEAGPSGLQQQKISDMPEMPIPQPTDGDPKSGNSTMMERSKELDSMQRLVALCPRSNTPDRTKIDQRLPFECDKELKNKLPRKVLRNCNKINDKPETVRKNENNLTNDSSLNGVNVDLISNRNIVDNRVSLKGVDSDLSSSVKTMKDDPIERAQNDLCINSTTQILLAIPDPVTNEIKNILMPIETRDASGLNVIKSVLVPIRDSNGVVSYNIKKVMVPIRSGLNLRQPSKVENKVILVDSANKPVKNQEKKDERISNENETRISDEVTLDVKNNVQYSSSEEATKNVTKDKEEEGDIKSQIVSIQQCQKEETDQILETLKNVCPVCQKVFKSENMMQRHVRKFHEKTYPCDKCNKCYPSKLSLEEHKKSHEDDSYLQCSMCHLKYKRKIGLKYHQIRVHSNVDPKFMCDYCGKRFKLKLDLSVHIEKIHMGIAHICKICGKVVKNITHHEWQHDRAAKKVVYKYSCDLCPKKFTTRNNLDNHLLMHKDGFKCTLCDEIFSSPFALGSHKSTKHRPGATCPICEKAFNSTSNFYQHVLTHAGIRPYKCDICGEDFTQRSSVLRHRKTHPGPLPPLTDPTPIADTARKILEQLSSA